MRHPVTKLREATRHSNPNAQNEPLNEYELRQFARGAMSLIHDDRMSSPIPKDRFGRFALPLALAQREVAGLP
jgi:hypothetical protein